MFSSVARSTAPSTLATSSVIEVSNNSRNVTSCRISARQPRGELVVARQAGLQAAAGIAADQPALLQHANAFAHRRTVDAELRHQLLLGADRLARLDPAVDDLALDRVGDLLIGRRDVDAPEQWRGGHLGLPIVVCRTKDRGRL